MIKSTHPRWTFIYGHNHLAYSFVDKTSWLEREKSIVLKCLEYFGSSQQKLVKILDHLFLHHKIDEILDDGASIVLLSVDGIP